MCEVCCIGSVEIMNRVVLALYQLKVCGLLSKYVLSVIFFAESLILLWTLFGLISL